MSKCKYFYPDGKEITKKQEFLDFYSEVYRYENHKQWDLELRMEKLLDPDNVDSLTTKNIADIFYWKTNRNPGSPEEEAEKEKKGEYCINSRNGEIVIRDELKEAQEFKRLNEPERKTYETCEIDESNAKDFLEYLVNHRFPASQSSGKTGEGTKIGIVYAITLLFFVTNGAYPIYDRYAHVGLKSVADGGNPTDEQSKITESYYCSKMFHSPGRNKDGDITGTAIDKAWKEYMGYKRLLMGKDAFGDVYGKGASERRKVDRALWAYGHLFYVPYEKEKKDGSNNK